jgi:hypothetical protein
VNTSLRASSACIASLRFSPTSQCFRHALLHYRDNHGNETPIDQQLSWLIGLLFPMPWEQCFQSPTGQSNLLVDSRREQTSSFFKWKLQSNADPIGEESAVQAKIMFCSLPYGSS